MKHIVTALLMSLFLAGCKTSIPIQNIDTAPIPQAGKQLTITEIEKAIIDAAIYKRWVVTRVSPGVMHAEVAVRNHMAKVEIKYNLESYSITYLDSYNLDFEEASPDSKYAHRHVDRIHRNYNKWVTLLNREITTNLTNAAHNAS